MANRRRKTAKWNAEIARNVVKDHASGISTEDMAQIYHVPEKRIADYLMQYGLLHEDVGVYRDEEHIVQARILQKLAEGRDPFTGLPLPPGILDRPEVLRALSAGAAALMVRKSTDRTGKPWKIAEEERLLDLMAMGVSTAEAAKRLHRTERAIEYKAEELVQRNAYLPSDEEKKAAMQRIRLRPKEESPLWTEEELRKLKDISRSGMDVLNIASYFGRSIEETEREIAKLNK